MISLVMGSHDSRQSSVSEIIDNQTSFLLLYSLTKPTFLRVFAVNKFPADLFWAPKPQRREYKRGMETSRSAGGWGGRWVLLFGQFDILFASYWLASLSLD